MEFEFDPAKSAANRGKHGIDFEEAQELWEVPGWKQPLPYLGEDRFLRIGRCETRLWAAVYTMRNDRVRLISVRRARQNEVKIYERFIESEEHDPQP